MKNYFDYRGEGIRLTEERRKHILDHPEMKGMMPPSRRLYLNLRKSFNQQVIKTLICITDFILVRKSAINIYVL